MSLYLFLLNGPPKSGKSTLAREALRWFNRRDILTLPEGFANPMRAFASSLLGVPYSSIAKDSPLPELNNETPREMLIALSETYLRLRYGRDFFGRLLQYRHRRVTPLPLPTVLVIEDSGFRSELSPLTPACLIRVLRPGFDFSSDSRSFLVHPDRTLVNDGTLEAAYAKTRDMVDYAINKWRLK